MRLSPSARQSGERSGSEREQLRHEYATLVLQLMSSDSSHSQTPGHKAADPGYVHSLSDQIEELDEQLAPVELVPMRSRPGYDRCSWRM